MSDTTNNRLEKKVDTLIEDVSSIKSIICEREKTEILRNEVITQSMKIQDKAIDNMRERVDKLENNQAKLAWLIISAVIMAVIGVVIIT